jgi:hypothetical protein
MRWGSWRPTGPGRVSARSSSSSLRSGFSSGRATLWEIPSGAAARRLLRWRGRSQRPCSAPRTVPARGHGRFARRWHRAADGPSATRAPAIGEVFAPPPPRGLTCRFARVGAHLGKVKGGVGKKAKRLEKCPRAWNSPPRWEKADEFSSGDLLHEGHPLPASPVADAGGGAHLLSTTGGEFHARADVRGRDASAEGSDHGRAQAPSAVPSTAVGSVPAIAEVLTQLPPTGSPKA